MLLARLVPFFSGAFCKTQCTLDPPSTREVRARFLGIFLRVVVMTMSDIGSIQSADALIHDDLGGVKIPTILQQEFNIYTKFSV